MTLLSKTTTMKISELVRLYILAEIAGCDMDIEDIKARVRNNQYVYSLHAEIERKADGLTFAQMEEALLNSQILE